MAIDNNYSPETLQAILHMTREKLGIMISVVAELEALLALEKSKNQELQQKIESLDTLSNKY